MSCKICIFCKKTFATKQNTERHQNSCKQKPINGVLNYEIEYKKTLQELENQKKENKKLQEKLEKKNEDFTNLTTTLLLKSIKEPSQINSNNTTNNNNQTNNQNINIFHSSDQSFKDFIEKLQPINLEEIKEHFETNLSNKYIDKGVEGVAEFLCDFPCNNKFITTDYARKIILFKSFNKLINDPKASFLLNTAIQQNADTIIDKAEDRYQYHLSQISDARGEDIEPDQSDIDKKNYTKNLKSIAQKAKNNITVNSSDATNIFLMKGMENKILYNAIENK
jgi:cell division septum initiation protein DivIVA